MTTTVVARSYLESFSTGDPEVIAAHVTDNFVNEHTAGLGAGCKTKAIYIERLQGFLRDMANLRYEIEDLIVQNNRVAAFYRMTALWQGETPIEIRGVQRLEFSGELISHRTDYWDSAVFLSQAIPAASKALKEFGVS